MHCVQRHKDLGISCYKKESPQNFPYIESDVESEDSDSDEPSEEPTSSGTVVTSSGSLANNFESRLSFGTSEPSIPGIEDYIPQQNRPQKYYKSFKDRFLNKPHRPFRGRAHNFRERPQNGPQVWNHNQYQNRSQERPEERPQETQIRPQETQSIPKDSCDSVFEEEFDVNFESNDALEDDNSIAIERPKGNPSMNPPNIPSAQQKTKQKKKKQKLKPNESLSTMTYKEHKQLRELMAEGRQVLLNSTPNLSATMDQKESQIPPQIDLQSTENELGLNETGIRNNKFKQIKRVGVPSDKSTKSQAVTYLTRDEEDDTFDEYQRLLSSTPKRGVKARFENQSHFELMPLNSQLKTGKNLFKCIICSNSGSHPNLQLRENNIQIHLTTVHNTESSLKCGYCDFIGQRKAILVHSELMHPGSGHKVEKFIVSISQNSAIGFTSESHLEKPKTARKSTGGANFTKASKGALTQRIIDSTFLGPLRGDTTQRKRKDSQSHEQYERVWSHSTHSSDLRSRKRQKTKERLVLSDSESDVDERPNEDFFPSDNEMPSDNESDMLSEIEVIPERSPPKKVSVAKKSTAKPPSSQMNISITLTEEDIPNKFFCVFCRGHTTLNDKMEAIEHYKSHLKLGYTCNDCGFFCVSYNSMEYHWTAVHKSDDMKFSDNMSDLIRQWIVDFLENQILWSDFAESMGPNPSGINIVCPLCAKAAKICHLTPRPFDALWKVKLHICKHLNWMPMKCSLCDDSGIMFPQNPYLLMKHLVDYHLISCENMYNISFRGQKPFNDMKREQMRLIERHFVSIRVLSGDTINSFFHQLMTQLDLNYENQLKSKFCLTKEILIKCQKLPQIKTEPIDELERNESKPKIEVKDKKDIKLLIKSEFFSEIKSQPKDEEINYEVNDEECMALGDDVSTQPIASTSGLQSRQLQDVEEVTLSSSDDES